MGAPLWHLRTGRAHSQPSRGNPRNFLHLGTRGFIQTSRDVLIYHCSGKEHPGKHHRNFREQPGPGEKAPIRDLNLGFKYFFSCCKQTQMCHLRHRVSPNSVPRLGTPGTCRDTWHLHLGTPGTCSWGHLGPAGTPGTCRDTWYLQLVTSGTCRDPWHLPGTPGTCQGHLVPTAGDIWYLQ